MKYTLIGTAGHVDHGKTSLIQALTGIDADRLKEEKQRGITIDIGFAYMKLPEGGFVSIVDVPGHEKFIKNMLAGAGGIDLVLLVIAADDSVMPQTREHLSILELLNAKNGVIALTKCDLVDSEWLGLVTEEIKEFTKDTFLKDAPLIPVSSHTGQGIDTLKQTLIEKIHASPSKNITAPPRLHIDRVFTMDGFGTIVTGTLIEGILHRGEMVQIYPKNKIVKVRHIQVHDQDVVTAYAGQRVALNLGGVKRDEIERGDILTTEGSMISSRLLDVKISVLRDSPRDIKSGSMLHFYYGTANILCKAVLLGGGKLPPGGEGYAQLRFAHNVSVKRNDSFVLRFYSPLETVGGGIVLNEDPKRFRQSRLEESVRVLESLEHGGITEQIEQSIEAVANLSEVRKRFSIEENEWQNQLASLAIDERISFLGSSHAIRADYRENLRNQITLIIAEFHNQNPLQSGMRKEVLRSKVLPKKSSVLFDAILALFDEFAISESIIAGKHFSISYTDEQSLIKKNIVAKFKAGGFSPPSLEDLFAEYQKGAKKTATQVFDALLADGILITTEVGIVFHTETINLGIEKLKEIGGEVTLAQFRDSSGTSRKFALSILEYYDRQKITKKVGDVRVILPNTSSIFYENQLENDTKPCYNLPC